MPSPSAERPVRRLFRPSVPTSFQSRLTYAFVGVVALTLALVSPVVINRFDDYFREQETQNLLVRRFATFAFIARTIDASTGRRDPVVLPDGEGGWTLNPRVRDLFASDFLTDVAIVAQADVSIDIGALGPGVDGTANGELLPVPDGRFMASNTAQPPAGLARDPTIAVGPQLYRVKGGVTRPDYGIRVELSQPYTRRASTVGAMTGLLMVIALIAFGIAVIVAAILSRRFTSPLRRLTDASRRIAEGDLASRVSPEAVGAGTLELSELAAQFNTMADRLEESVAIIRRDRDRSRDFLADVSHELRDAHRRPPDVHGTAPGQGGREAGDPSGVPRVVRDPARAPGLAGPEPARALEAGLGAGPARPPAGRHPGDRGVGGGAGGADRGEAGRPPRAPAARCPVRIRHDPPRVGQIVTNLVGNALKFTGRGGRVRVVVRPGADGAAQLEVSDTGAGIDADELPRIFERFFRGSRMHEVRSTGSGLGLAIVKSIVDMHGGTIAVESQVGKGSTFVVTLPRDPREAIEAVPGPTAAATPSATAEASATPAAVGRSPGPAPAPSTVSVSPDAVPPARSPWSRPGDDAQIRRWWILHRATLPASTPDGQGGAHIPGALGARMPSPTTGDPIAP